MRKKMKANDLTQSRKGAKRVERLLFAFLSVLAPWRDVVDFLMPSQFPAQQRGSAGAAPALALLGALLFTAPVFASSAIEGQIVNGTTGRPAAGQRVELLTPESESVRQVGVTVTDSAGRFAFVRSDLKPSAFYLLQAAHQGVSYHEPVRFRPDGNASASFKIYDSTQSLPPIRISNAQIRVRAQGENIQVEELFAVRNDTNPPVAYVDPNGTFRFHLAGSAQPSVAVAGEMNMALPQQAQPGNSPGQFFIQYPLKPGLTVVMVAYETDYASQTFRLADSVPYPIEQLELDVVPATLAVDSSLFKSAGEDQEIGGRKLLAENLKPSEPFEAGFHGSPLAATGSENPPQSGAVKEVPNPITRLGWPLLGCFLLVLLWAMGVRISKDWTRRDIARPGSPVLKELETNLEQLLDSVANLDELFEAGKIPEKKYWRERLDLKAKLVVLLKKTPPAFLESYATRHNPR
jgi:hypothetical protein